MSKPQRSFSETEVQAILERAIDRAGSGKATLSLDELVGIGAELGVSRAAIESAAAEVAHGAAAPSVPADNGGDAESKAIREWRTRARRGWFHHLFIYLAVNAFLLFVNLMSSPGYLWFLWPLAGWGLGVVLSSRRALFLSDDEVHDIVSRKERRRQKRESRRGGRRARIAPVDDANLRTRIDQRVDAVLAERGVRIRTVDAARDAIMEADADDDEDIDIVSSRKARKRQR